MSGSLASVANHLGSVKQVLVCAHVSPDPDAIGSAGALCHLLKDLGHETALYVPEGLPERFKELVRGLRIVRDCRAFDYETVFAVDTASAQRLGLQSDELLAKGVQVINVDHHGSNTLYGTENYVDADAAASAVLVYRLYIELGMELSVAAANLLYAGLLDDTGSFRYSNTNAEAFQVAAALLAAGANPEYLANMLYFSVPERVLRLKAEAVKHLEVVLDGKLALIAVTNDILESLGASSEETEGIVDIARSVQGVCGAVFLREAQDSWKASLRAKDAELDVNQIAASFGGGGHRAAAGCRLEGELDEVKAAIVAEFKRAFAEQKSGQKSG